ncbi:MAG: NADH-quinone oxidoreductase subunit B family protein [archaeon GB-1867-035]|nr:NADH-quinone oxidoreductase subunit B family protein [Candidatus Culexmicrobium profundum]
MVSIIGWSRIRSPWILYMGTGHCNACDIEVLAVLAPRFDVERFGILLKGSPRHADVLVVTGAVSRQTAPRLKRIYEQMPNPKFVIAVGTCACSGGVYWGCYNVLGGIDKVIPVDVYIPGCPVRPEAVIQGVAKLLAKLQGGGKK